MTIVDVKNKRTQVLFLSGHPSIPPAIYTNVELEMVTDALTVEITDTLAVKTLPAPPPLYVNVEVELLADALTVEITDALTIELLCGYSSEEG